MFGAFFAPQELKRNRTKTWKGTEPRPGREQDQDVERNRLKTGRGHTEIIKISNMHKKRKILESYVEKCK